MSNLIKNWKKYNGVLFLEEMMRSFANSKLNPNSKKYATRQKYGKKYKLSAEETNNFYRDLILLNEPFLAARFGSAEMRRINRYIMIKLGLAKEYSASHLRGVLLNKSPEMVGWYAEQIINLLPNVDIMPAWCPIGEPYFIRQFANKTKLCTLKDIEPFFHENPWSSALKGKKVMVINPFVESIKSQYQKRELLFENKDILPEFELHTVKSVMILSPEDDVFDSMIDAIEYMYQEAMKVDFDIVLLGCGPMGMPLAERFRQQGKQSIYLGGSLQLLFGIKGKRWDSQEKYTNLYNEHWIYPMEEPPKNAERLDSACYWK